MQAGTYTIHDTPLVVTRRLEDAIRNDNYCSFDVMHDARLRRVVFKPKGIQLGYIFRGVLIDGSSATLDELTHTLIVHPAGSTD